MKAAQILYRIRTEGLLAASKRAAYRLHTPWKRRRHQQWLRQQAMRALTDTELLSHHRLTVPRGSPVGEYAVNALDQQLRQRSFAGLADPSTAAAIATHCPAAREATLERSAGILAGRLGWLAPDLDESSFPPDWHRAMCGESHARWPVKPSWEYQESECYAIADLRLSWEANRHQFATSLGRAYLHTGEEQYALAAAELLLDWIATNPFCVGIHWLHSQEVALRLKSILWLYGSIIACDKLAASDRLTIHKAIWQHAEFITHDLSRGPETHNHLLNELCGLAHFCLLYPNSKLGKKWLRRTLSSVQSETLRQFWSDGAPIEGSVGYHLFVLESLVELASHCATLKHPLDPLFLQRLGGMLDFAKQAFRPDGSFPRVGDTDDGRGVRLTDLPGGEDRKEIVHCGERLLGKRASETTTTFCEAAYWLLGPQGTPPLQTKAVPATGDDTSFERAGFFFLHSPPRHQRNDLPEAEDNHVLFLSGTTCENSAVKRAHLHADALSMVWWHRGYELLTDPATLLYGMNHRLRTSTRRTNAHSTLQVGESDHFDVTSWRFSVGRVPAAHIVRNDTGPGWRLVTSRIPAGPSAPHGEIVLERTALWRSEPGYLLLLDRFVGTGLHDLRQWFQVGAFNAHIDDTHPIAKLSHPQLKETFELRTQSSQRTGHLTIHTSEAAHQGPGWRAERYGAAIPSTTLVIVHERSPLPLTAATYLGPTLSGDEAFQVDQLTPERLRIGVELERTRHEIELNNGVVTGID